MTQSVTKATVHSVSYGRAVHRHMHTCHRVTHSSSIVSFLAVSVATFLEDKKSSNTKLRVAQPQARLNEPFVADMYSVHTLACGNTDQTGSISL